MSPTASGFLVVLADHTEAPVPDGREYEVEDDGTLTFHCGSQVVATFPPGEWAQVKQLGLPLRATWPPEDFDTVIDKLLFATVRQRLWYLPFFDRERFRDPVVNDFDAFVDEVLTADGRNDHVLFSEQRREVCEIVAEVFGVENLHPRRGH